MAIEGLPFTSQGYEEAKNILKSRYGSISDVVNPYVQNIFSLPFVHESQPKKVCDFYEKLLYIVESLQILGRLKQVNGYIRSTIDKLDGIRGDLTRTSDDWRK